MPSVHFDKKTATNWHLVLFVWDKYFFFLFAYTVSPQYLFVYGWLIVDDHKYLFSVSSCGWITFKMNVKQIYIKYNCFIKKISFFIFNLIYGIIYFSIDQNRLKNSISTKTFKEISWMFRIRHWSLSRIVPNHCGRT